MSPEKIREDYAYEIASQVIEKVGGRDLDSLAEALAKRFKRSYFRGKPEFRDLFYSQARRYFNTWFMDDRELPKPRSWE